MNEITRIHLAKTAYEIEIPAKKELEKYIKSVEQYANDADVVMDVEIRITELLAERGVRANGVIAKTDVIAVRKQLGEPQEFADVDEEGDMAVGSYDDTESRDGRKLYRSMDDAVLGGVLSGMANYFNVNPIWTRLVFVILLFLSFGLVVVLYLLFWLITPAARTAAEKLTMTGRPVTISSIRTLNDVEEGRGSRAPILQTIFRVGAGFASIFAAFATFTFTLWAVIVSVSTDAVTEFITGTSAPIDSWVTWVVGILIVLGLMALTALFGLIAYALLYKRFTKRIGMSIIATIIVGLSLLAAVIGIGITQSINTDKEIQKNTKTINAVLPVGFSQVKHLNVKATKGDNELHVPIEIAYAVTSGTPRYEFVGLAGSKPTFTVDGDTVTMGVQSKPLVWGGSYPRVTIYGPALESISNESSSFSYNGKTQDALKVTVGVGATMTSLSGTYAALTIEGADTQVSAAGAVVTSLTVNAQSMLRVEAGTVRDLTVTQPDVCQVGIGSEDTAVVLAGVTSGMMTYNGVQKKAENYKNSCASVRIGGELDDILEED